MPPRIPKAQVKVAALPIEGAATTILIDDRIRKYESFILSKVKYEVLRRIFYHELEMGFITFKELEDHQKMLEREGKPFATLPVSVIKTLNSRIQFEILENLSSEDYVMKLDKAVEDKDYSFDTGLARLDSQVEDYIESDIIFFANRSMEVVSDKPCRSCGKKALVSEASRMVRRADEQSVKFVRCKNCNARMNPDWLL